MRELDCRVWVLGDCWMGRGLEVGIGDEEEKGQ